MKHPILLTALGYFSWLTASQGVILPYAEYRLGEAGSLGQANGNTTSAPLDSGGSHLHFTHSNTANTAIVATEGVFAPSSTAYIDTSEESNNGWFATDTIYHTLPKNNFAFGVYVRASSLAAKGTVFGLGDHGGVHLGLGSEGWGAWISDGAGGAKSWIGHPNGSPGSFTANTWVHLALIRCGGVSTFYLNGVAQDGTSSIEPVHGKPHLSVDPEGGSAFDGHIDEIRIFTISPTSSTAKVLELLRQHIVVK